MPKDFKGTHMSRFVEVLNAHGRLVHVENIEQMLHELQRKLHAQVAHIEMEFPYFMEKEAPVTKAKGLVDYEVKFDAAAHGQRRDLHCHGRHSRSRRSAPAPRRLAPMAHTTSAATSRSPCVLIRPIWIEDMIALVEASASSEIFSLLKRPDEKFVTEQAYDNPVFVEDLVRATWRTRCNQHPDITWYKVEAENMESIHNHSAYASIEKPTP